MEVGVNCPWPGCNQLSFLPLSCRGCKKAFCEAHYKPEGHRCPVESAYQEDVTAITCPVCNRVVPVPREIDSTKRLDPNGIVMEHIERGCPNPGLSTVPPKKVHKCSFCPSKELMLVQCRDCFKPFCLKHRHPEDHKCKSSSVSADARRGNNSSSSSLVSTSAPSAAGADKKRLQSDEEYARALQESLYEEATPFEQTKNSCCIQ